MSARTREFSSGKYFTICLVGVRICKILLFTAGEPTLYNCKALLLRMGVTSWSVHPQIMSLSWVDYDRNNLIGSLGKMEDVPVCAPAGACPQNLKSTETLSCPVG